MIVRLLPRISVAGGLAAIVAIGVLIIWLATWDPTFANEVNPLTLEVRVTQYREYPLIGRVGFSVVEPAKEMAFGRWLKENGLLPREKEGYWVLVKSFSPQWGFDKGAGISLRHCFSQGGALTSMPHISAESDNPEWKEWCVRNPQMAKLVWTIYARLADKGPASLSAAADVLSFARYSMNKRAEIPVEELPRLLASRTIRRFRDDDALVVTQLVDEFLASQEQATKQAEPSVGADSR